MNWIRESHTWINYGTEYRCRKCDLRSPVIPGEMMNLPDEELELYLASLTDEEFEAFLASLPEDELARVTAILTPENDDELLTE